MKIHTITHKMLADTFTPVSLYLKVRNKYSQSLLLESSDYHSKENSYSFICLEPLATFQVKNGVVIETIQGEGIEKEITNVTEQLKAFVNQFQIKAPKEILHFNGLFGHTSFDAVQHFDTIKLDKEKRKFDLPDLNYSLYRYIIAINHFNDSLTLLENLLPNETSQLHELETLIQNKSYGTYQFSLEGEEGSNLTDTEFKNLVTKGKEHCQAGDVFQLVLSRQFSQQFKGDDFNVYRVLRSVNPSPYLFYFDYGNYKIFGSSPEAQMLIKDRVAEIHPIAGTYRRTGDDEADRKSAEALSQDPKENAEHIMLVDLARNDLSRNTDSVTVTKLKEIQYFSHVIHLVSKVEGKLNQSTNPIQIFADTFPAGTLSGAPKYKALELIDKYENQNRAFYGGGIGYIGFNGDMNQAIVIRSFLSQANTLYCQAGAGIVVASDEEKELQEVNNKLGALKQALKMAEKI